jgi:outer membrane lipoprotein-sorting protein
MQEYHAGWSKQTRKRLLKLWAWRPGRRRRELEKANRLLEDRLAALTDLAEITVANGKAMVANELEVGKLYKYLVENYPTELWGGHSRAELVSDTVIRLLGELKDKGTKGR